MMKTTQIILLMVLLTAVGAARIYPWGEPYIKYPNKGLISTMKLFFSLETKLPAGHALRIRLPFTTAPNVSGVTAYAQTSTRGTVATPTSGTIAGTQYSAKSVSPFDLYYFFASDLNAGTNYVLEITFGTSPNDVGWLGYVQLETMSPAASLTSASSTDVPITYDLNNAFAPIHIFQQPGIPTFSLGNTEASATPTTAAATYVQPLKLQLSNDFWFWPTIVISWSGSAGFSFGQCVSADIGVNTTATPLAASRYTCAISSTDQTITINHNDPINKTQNVVYNVSITNPKNGGSTTLSVIVYHRFNLNVTDNNPSAITLNVNAPAGGVGATAVTLSSVQALLSWGIDRKNGATSLLQNVFQIYTSSLSDFSTTFQGVRFVFALSSTLPSGTYQVILNVCSGSTSCWILENSIDHNLGSNIVCTASNPTTGNVQVTCPGVTSLQQTGNYIGVRSFFANTLFSAGSLSDSQFGQLAIKSQTTTAGVTSYTDYISAIALDASYKACAKVPAVALLANVNGNGPLLGTTDSNTWNGIIDSTNGVAAFNTFTGTRLKYVSGIFVSTSPTPPAMNLALFTTIKMDTEYIASSGKNIFGSTISGLTTIAAKSGVDVFLNPNLWTAVSTVDKSTCWVARQKKNSNEHTPTTGAHCHSVANSSTSNWIRLRYIFTAVDTPANVESNATALMGFYWPGFVQQKAQYSGTSLKADVNVPDYYAAFYLVSGTIPNSVTINATTSGATAGDVGDLGGTSLTSTAVPGTITSLVWSQYFLVPYSVDSSFAATSYYAGLSVWLSSFSNQGSTPSLTQNDAVSVVRARGILASTDPAPATAKLALFFQVPSSTFTNGYATVGATGTTTYTCFSSASGNKCSNDRTPRPVSNTVTIPGSGSITGQPLNQLDLYQVISTDAVFSTSANQTVGIIVDFVYLAQASMAANFLKPRWGFIVSSGTYYINGGDSALANIAASAQTLTSTTTATCDGTTTVPNVGPSFGQAAQIVNQNNSVTVVNYKISSGTISSTNGYGNIMWCARWNFQTSSFGFSNTSGLESSTLNDKCVPFTYTSSTPTKWYCVYCPISVSANSPPTTSASRSFNVTNFLNGNAVTILESSWGLISNDEGVLQEKATCTTWTNAFTAGTATGSSTGSAFGQIGQKVLISVTLASTIAGIDTITIEGRNSSAPASVDSSFPQATIDTNAECWLVSTTDTSVSNYIQIGCPNSPSGSLTFNGISVSSPKSAQNNWQIIIWGFTGNTAPATPPASLYFMIKSQRSSALVDQSSTVAASNLIAWPILSAANNFTLLSPTYNRGVLNSRGTFRWDFSFPSTRPMYYKDTVVFSLDAISTSAQNNNVNTLKCRITDNVGVANQNFRACSFSSSVTPATLTIVTLPRSISFTGGSTSFAVFDFVMSGVRVHLDGIQAIALQATKTIYGKVFFGGINGGSAVSLTKDNTATDINAPTDVSSKGFPLNYPVVNKYWAAPGSYGDLAFTLISNVQFNETCRITVEFPTYYSPGLSARAAQPFCSVDGVNTHCQISGPRTLQVDGFPTAKSANTQFIIRVSGIPAPSITTADNFWIQLNQDLSDSASTVIYAGAIAETIVASQTITPFHVNWMNVTSGVTRTSTTFTWTCNPLGIQNYTTNHSVHVLFPPHWGMSWNVFTPTCQVVDYATPTTVYSAAQSIVGDNVFMNLQTTLPQSQIVNIVCQNIRTPDTDTTYPSQEIQIRIVDQAGTTIYQHSAPSVHNTNFAYQFAKAATLSYVNWDQTTSSSIVSPISLPRGTFAAQLMLNMPARSVRNFQIAVTPSTFAFWPSPFNVSTGQTSVRAYVGCAQGTPINNYALLFTLSDSSTYTSPPISFFQVTMNKVNLAVTSGPISVLFVQGTVVRSYPVIIDSSSNAPFSDLTVTPTPPTNANFTVTPSAVTLTPSNPWGAVVFASTANTVSGESDTFSFVLSGTNINAFNVPPNLVVTASADTTNQTVNTPTFTITADGSDQTRATTKVLSLNMGGSVTVGTAYFGCQLAGTWTLGQTGLQAAAAKQAAFDPFDPVQGQYSTIVLLKSQQSVLVSNLHPNSYYECQGFVVSQTNRTSTPMAVFTFKTASNGGSIIRWLFNHTAYPTAAQRQRLLCGLTSTLGVPALRVVAVTGEICGNSTAFYTTANSTGDLAVYFYPLDLETDAVITLANLQAALNTTVNLNALNNTVVAGDAAGAPIYNIIPDGIVTVNQLSPSFPSSASVGTNYAAVSGITLNDTGYVFAAIASNTSTTPSALSLKLAAAANASAYIGGVQVGYYSSATGPLSFNFSSLQPSTSYTLFLVGTNNDPSFLSNFTAVSAIPVTTQALPTTPVSAMALFTSLLAVVVSMLALQLI